jgi:AcrR family transcriptional regulator
VEAARSLALDTGVASVALAGVADRVGVHYSAVRRYFSCHKEVLLYLAAEGWTRWSNTVCAALREPAPMSPSRVAGTLADGLAADPLFCDLLANLHLHLEHEVDLDRLVEIRRTSAAAEISLADAIEHALPVLGRSGALNVLLAACSLTAYFWQIAHPPQRLIDAFAEEPQVLPDWNLRFRIRAYPTSGPLPASVSSPSPLSETKPDNPTRFYDKDVVAARPNPAVMPLGAGPYRRFVAAMGYL